MVPWQEVKNNIKLDKICFIIKKVPGEFLSIDIDGISKQGVTGTKYWGVIVDGKLN